MFTTRSTVVAALATLGLVPALISVTGQAEAAPVVPRAAAPAPYSATITRTELEERPLLDLSSGYIQRSIQEFPRQGDHGPWRVRQNYLLDSLTTMRRGLRGSMDFTPRSAVRTPAVSQQDDALTA